MTQGTSGVYKFNPITGEVERVSDSIPQGKPDVFFKEPAFEPHLADADKHPLGQEVRSPKHKRDIMRQLGLRESGDRVHGARGEHRPYQGKK